MILLAKRGEYLKFDKQEKADEITEELKEIHKNELIKITTPIKAFITFETMEAKERCVKYLSKDSHFG